MKIAARAKIGLHSGSIAASAAGLAATSALVCAVACILPFALPAAVLAIVGGALAWFGRMYEGAVYAALILVAVAWSWIVIQSLHARRGPAVTTLIVMLAATATLVLAYHWPSFENVIIMKLGGP